MRVVTVVNRILFCVWFILLSVLLYRHYYGTALERNEVYKEYFRKDTVWYDIYAGKSKVGFAETTRKKAGDEIIIEHRREMNVVKNGEETRLVEKLKTLCDSFHSIKSFEYWSHYNGNEERKVRAEVTDDEVVFFLESPEKRKTYTIPTNGKDFYHPITLLPVLQQKVQVVEKPILIPMLNLSTFSIDDVIVNLEEIQPVKLGPSVMSLYKYRIRDSFVWTDDNGVIVKDTLTPGLALYYQIEDLATEIVDRTLLDFTIVPVLKSNTLLQDPENLSLMRVRLRGFRTDPLLYKDSFVTKERDTLSIRKTSKTKLLENEYTLPFEDGDLLEYLHPDEWVKSGSQPLRDTGRTYARSYDHDAVRFARYLNNYVYNLVKRRPVFALVDSKTVLKSLSGDHVERTLLLASYARAGELPTRLVGGLVYREGYFYFHTWPEVWINRWVPLDPTLLQFPADVTHIPLKGGTMKDILSITEDLGSLEIEVLEAS
jgi:hypothetical protein